MYLFLLRVEVLYDNTDEHIQREESPEYDEHNEVKVVHDAVLIDGILSDVGGICGVGHYLCPTFERGL